MQNFEVAVSAPIKQSLTYSITSSDTEHSPQTLLTDHIGKRVLVPLRGRKVTGYITGVSEESYNVEQNTFQIKKIIRFLDELPIFHADLVPFFRWIADYYQYPIGLVIKAALPGGLTPTSQKLLRLSTSSKSLKKYFADEIPQWAAGLLKKNQLTPQQTKQCLANKQIRKIINDLVAEGLVELEENVSKDQVTEKKEICYSFQDPDVQWPEADFNEKQEVNLHVSLLSSQLGKKIKFAEAKAILCLVHLLKENNITKDIPLKELKKVYPSIGAPLKKLANHNLVLRSSKRVYRSPFGVQLPYYPKPDALTPDQEKVIQKISPEIENRSFHTFLLHGITGSGKTEVYLRAAEHALTTGRDVIVIVPEIALATQLEAQLFSRFGENVVQLHSGMSRAEKYDQYYRALTGKAKVVIGARSAIFAPLKDPGLIIVDEEHDSGFKQDDNFRYNGRDIAIVRGRHHGSVVILGSATPSVTSYHNAKKGKYTLLNMTERVGESCLPQVNLVDLSKAKEKGKSKIIKSKLLEGLRENLEKKKQSVLLLNRRGFSAALMCQDCGIPVQCEHCNVSLTLHKELNKLVCHYCGFVMHKDVICVHCRSTNLIPAGFGTERVAEEVAELLPEARVSRIDSDTAADRKRFMNAMSAMHNHEVDILIGTQMIAKGHHFPRVTLVGVVWADGGMSMPDYKAAERTYQLITQVTGRAGRGEYPGRVIIQSMRPEHYAIQFAKKHDYKSFYEHEIGLRSNPLFPPFVRLVLLRVQGRVEQKVQKSCRAITAYCRQVRKSRNYSLEILGPAPAPLDKIKDNYRWQILLKVKDLGELRRITGELSDKQKEIVEGNCTLIIDVDPENMM